MIKLRKENRKEQLRNAGMDTSKYFEFKVNQDIPKGSTLRVTVENNGREYDEIEQQIIDNGIIPVEGTFRRWIMVQYLKMTNYEGENDKNNGYHGYLKEQIDYNYTMKRLVAEAYEMSELERKFDYDELDKRKQFFSHERIVKIFEDYICKINDIMKGDFYIANKGHSHYSYDNELTFKYYDICFDRHKYNTNEKCCDTFKTIGKNTFCYYRTALDYIEGIVNTHETLKDMYDKSYKYIYKVLKDFYLDYYIIIPEDLSDVIKGKEKGITKSKEWVEGYKRAGVYYTLQNMIENHGIKFTHDDYPIDGMKLLNHLVFERRFETYKLHRMLQDILIENNFNLHESIMRNS